MLSVLKTAMRVLGFTNRDIERQLGLSSSYLSRLFSGTIELRFEHIVEIARAMGLEPAEILSFSYPQRREPSAAALRLRELMGSFQGTPAAAPPAAVSAPSLTGASQAPPSEAELERLMAKTIRRLFGEARENGRVEVG